MITVSDKMKEYLSRTGRTFKGKIDVGEQTVYEGILNIFIDRSMCSDSLKLGEVNSAYCTISVYEPSVSFAGEEITVYIAAVIDGEDDWKKLGVFTTEKPSVSDKEVEFTAFDCIKYKTDITYFPTLEGESAVSAVFEDICNQCGIPFANIESALTINPAKLSGRKCKDALGQIAGFLGGNIVTDNEGRVDVRCFTECDYTVDEDMMTEPTIGEAMFTLDGISCTVGDEILISGNSSGNILAFSNVLMTQEQLNSIFERYKSLTYHSVSVENIVGNPFIEVGDIISMVRHGNVYKIPVMHLTVDFDGGVMNDIETYHKTTEEESGGKSASDVIKEIEQIKTDNKLSSDFSNAISNALGIYYSKQTLEDGSYKIYGHNKESLANSTYIFTSTDEGFAFVTGDKCWNDGNPEWQYGVSKDGNAILNTLVLHKLSSVDGSTSFDLTNAVLRSEREDVDAENNEWRCETTLSNGEFIVKKFKNGKQMDTLQISMNNHYGAQISGMKIVRKDVSEFEVPDGWDSEESAIKYLAKLIYYNGTASFKVMSSDASKNTASFLLDDAVIFPRLLNNFFHETSYRVDGATIYGPVEASAYKILTVDENDNIISKELLDVVREPITIPAGTAFNTLIEDGTYVGGATLGNGTTANFENSPSVVNQSFSIVVSPVGDKGQKKQRLTTCSKTAAKVFERFYYQDTWGEWFCTSDFGTSLLWDGSVASSSGGIYMNGSQVAELSEPIREQPNGILLIFSCYADGNAKNYWFNTFFKSKFEVGKFNGVGHSFFLMSGSDFEAVGSKYLYIYDDKITGNANNTKTGTTNGITYANNKFVLRYVIGV